MDDGKGSHSPIAPQSCDALVAMGYRAACDPMMWTPTAKTRKYMTEKGLRFDDIPIPGPLDEGEGGPGDSTCLVWSGKFAHKVRVSHKSVKLDFHCKNEDIFSCAGTATQWNILGSDSNLFWKLTKYSTFVVWTLDLSLPPLSFCAVSRARTTCYKIAGHCEYESRGFGRLAHGFE